jgi:hypothetical protein
MKKVIQLSLLVCLMAAFAFNTNAASRDLDLKPFTGFVLTSHYNVVLKQGSKQKVKVEGPQEILDKMNTTVSDGIWKIYDKRKGKNSWKGNSGKVTVYITLPKLKYVGVTGSGNVKCDQFNAKDVKLKVTGSGDIKMGLKASSSITAGISGSGNIKLNGSSGTFKGKVTGSGSIKGIDMKVNTANATITGSGNIYIHCKEAITAKITGSGNVKYKGDPKVESRSTGSGKVKSYSK